jgi:indolepyruvate ferredoxin oxidoreductase beta subunit
MADKFKSDTTSVVLVGVGGQGILLASEIVARAAMKAGFDVKTNEVHGMAQRGGSVIAQIRFGEDVNSPLVEEGTATVLGSLERIEALRHYKYLAPGGLCVVNTQIMVPVTVSMGAGEYPDDAIERLKKVFGSPVLIDAGQKAVELGNIKAANVIVVGAISKGIEKIPVDAWHEAIKMSVKPKFIDLNLKAFEVGRSSV